MTFDSKHPYNDLPPLPPETDIETRAILKKCVGAGRALEGLRQSGILIPNQSVLINTIPLLEAGDSSKIENIVTTTDDLFRYADAREAEADPATKEALRYRTALFHGFQKIGKRPISTATAVEVCRTIKGIELNIRTTPGTALKNAVTGEIIYTPPEGETTLRKMLANWERFLHETEDVDPLIRMAVMHYQFEAIHPFTDGNGRTGRVLNILFLIQAGLLNIPILYLSRYFIRHREAYYKLLLDVTRRGEWEPWILYVLSAVEETALWTTLRISTIRKLMEHTGEHIREYRPRIYRKELVELIFAQPYCRIMNLVDAGLVGTRQTASTHLKQLCAIGILTERKEKKEKLYVNTKFLELLVSEDNNFRPYEETI